jgi:cytochrome c biogenesis protein CcmG, thiol:disulfide interchange protein DsbE
VASRVGSNLAVGVVAAVLAALCAALVLSVLADDDAEPAAITLDPDGGTAPQVDLTGERAPAFDVESLDGETTAFTELRDGRPAVINFFASWCTPCVREMPGLESVHQELGDQVQFVGLSERETADDARALVEETGVTYAIGRDPGGDILTAYSGLGMPTTVLVAADGTITSSHTGRLERDELEQAVRDELLR